MGSAQGNCHSDTAAKDDIVVRQMNIYKWRAQNSSKYIPAIEFKNETHVKEQEKLSDFIQRYRQKDYLELYKLKKQLEQVDSNGQQIITFQKYACTLDELTGSLNIQETVYVLQALLTAYEQIKKIYTSSIPVSPKYCFVTLKGQVRAWINSNPKSNQIENIGVYKYFTEREYKAIVLEIVEMTEQLSVKDIRVGSLIMSLKNYLNGSILRNDIFSKVRNFIYGYCNTANITSSQNLSNAIRRSTSLSLLKLSRRSTSKNKSNSLQSKTDRSHSRNYSNTSEQCKSQCWHKDQESVAKRSGIASTHASVVGFNQQFLPQDTSFTANQIHIRQQSFTFRRFSEVQTPPLTTKTQNNKPMFRASQGLPSTPKPIPAKIEAPPAEKKTQIKNQASINDNIHSSNNTMKVEEQGTLLQSNFLTSREETNTIGPASRARRQLKYKTSNFEKKPARRISILDLGDEENYHPEERGSKVHFRTHKDMNKLSDKSLDPQRPWITSRTIQKLITDKEPADSLVHSMGSSSEYAESSYSGALSNMGRKVRMTKREVVCQDLAI